MSQPMGYVDSNFPTHVCKLYKAVYGLKQAPRVWYSCLSEHLLALSFANSSSDTSLLAYRSGSVTIFILVYVDYILITRSSADAISKLIADLTIEFVIKDLGTLSYFLGI